MLQHGTNSDKTSATRFGFVPQTTIPLVWPQIDAILSEKGTEWLQILGKEEIYSLLVNGHVDLWVGAEGNEIEFFVICEHEQHQNGSYYHALLAAGKNLRSKYLSIGLEVLEQYACLLGSRDLVLEGRKGFSRILAPFGYRNSSIRMRKRVDQLRRH